MTDSAHANATSQNDEIVEITLEESVKKRPGMYFGELGGKGAVRLIKELIVECIKVCAWEEFTFIVSIKNNNTFSIEIDGVTDLIPFLQRFNGPTTVPNYLFYARTVSAISKRLEISDGKTQAFFTNEQWQFNNYNDAVYPQTHTTITCEIDETIFRATNIDYLYLNQELVLIPIVSRKTEIVIRDERTKYLNQSFYSIPEGIYFIFDKIIKSFFGEPRFQIGYEGKLDQIQYQIVIGGCKWDPSITSFANYIHTTCHGSLVDGIIYGIISACKKYAKENKLKHFKITRKKILKNLLIVCSVKGAEFEYGGNTRQKLLSKTVESQSKELVFNWIYSYLQKDKKVSDSFMLYFDKRDLFSSES